MPRTFKKILPVSASLVILLTSVVLLMRCKEPYNSPYVSPTTGFLVVEGYISGNTPTIFTLSRTIKLSSDTTNPQEPGANVQVEGNDNSVYPLAGQGNGVYATSTVLPLYTSVMYRLRIQTQSGGQYLSDYAPYKITPVIDSINWVENANGVTIYANAHDDAGTTKYYQWSYGETWEYHSAESSGLEYVDALDTVIPRPLQDQIFRCWHTDSSSNVLIGNSVKLAEDVIYEQPLRQIQKDSVQLSVLYTINVRQYALTDSGYNYLSLLQKNTESLGTIFDPQPSQLYGGNIHCLTNSNETVIGYVSAGTVREQRIFINVAQLPDWHYPFACPGEDIKLGSPSGLGGGSSVGGLYTPLYGQPEIGLIYVNFTSCVDCRTQGGTTNKPSFWPN